MKRRAAIAAVSSTLLLAGCLSEDENDDIEFHGRGEIEVVVDGEPIDLSEDRFQADHADNHSLAFHLHERDEYWYMEGEEPVTFAEAIDLLPHFEYEGENGDHVVRFDGTTYETTDPGTEMTFSVNGDEVDPIAYELRDGDEIRLEISTAS